MSDFFVGLITVVILFICCFVFYSSTLNEERPEPVIYRAEIGNDGTRIDVILKSSGKPASIEFNQDGQVWIYMKDEPGIHIADAVKGALEE